MGLTETKPAAFDQDQSNHEYAYAEVNKEKTTIAEPDLDNVYQDVQDKPEEDSYAYADVKTASDGPSDGGLILIYAQSKRGGAPVPNDKQDPVADTDIYQSIPEDNTNENEYAYADVNLDDNVEPAKQQEGWADNVIYGYMLRVMMRRVAPWTCQKRRRKRIGLITVSTLVRIMMN